MAIYRCTKDNQFDGVRGYRKGQTYTFDSTPDASLFELVPSEEANLIIVNDPNLPVHKDLEGDYHVHENVQFEGVASFAKELEVHALKFDTDEDHTVEEGKLSWSATEETLTLGMPGSDVALQVGMEMYLPRKVKNTSGVDMVNGDLVYISGGDGNNAYIALAKADAGVTAKGTIAMLTEDIADNAKGYASTRGIVRDIDTSSYVAGDVLYLSPTVAGEFIGTLPEHPNYAVRVGMVFRSHASAGSVIVNIEKAVCAKCISGGDDAVWDDLRFPATRIRQGATAKPDFDDTELGLLFPQNDATEQAFIIGQMPHPWLLQSEIRPHLHYIQEVATQPTFKLDYRIYKNNTTVPGSWTTLSTADGSKGVFSYTSGNLAQIASFPSIDLSAIDTVSAILDLIVYRDDDDVTGDVLMKEFDIHFQTDSFGSRDEFTKG